MCSPNILIPIWGEAMSGKGIDMKRKHQTKGGGKSVFSSPAADMYLRRTFARDHGTRAQYEARQKEEAAAEAQEKETRSAAASKQEAEAASSASQKRTTRSERIRKRRAAVAARGRRATPMAGGIRSFFA